eukprot:m.97296 g.97296  ORF g.97296 m.97296 type:complete len:358 (-) comp12492_c0_seq4:127-1200(-)
MLLLFVLELLLFVAVDGVDGGRGRRMHHEREQLSSMSLPSPMKSSKVQSRSRTLAGELDVEKFKAKCPTKPLFVASPTKLKMAWWIHPPKTGTSFGQCLIQYACPKLDQDLQVVVRKNKLPNGKSNHNLPPLFKHFMKKHYTPENCDITTQFRTSAHDPVKGKPHGIVMMVRDPRRRHYSAWKFHHEMGTPAHPSDLMEYIKLYKGCQMRLLVGRNCEFSQSTDPKKIEWNPSQKVVQKALSIINKQDKVAFVGLTDEWDTSICLFHAMFGGEITPHEMQNIRPSIKTEEDKDAWKQIPTTSDPYDWLLYEAARVWFVKNLFRFGIAVPPSLKDVEHKLATGESKRKKRKKGYNTVA